MRGCGWPGRLVVQAEWLCRLSEGLLIPSLSLSSLQVAETFMMAAEEGGPELRDVATLDTCVTLVDAANLMLNL